MFGTLGTALLMTYPTIGILFAWVLFCLVTSQAENHRSLCVRGFVAIWASINGLYLAMFFIGIANPNRFNLELIQGVLPLSLMIPPMAAPLLARRIHAFSRNM